MPPKLQTCLWFNTNNKPAVNFYLSVFGCHEIDQIYYNSAGPVPEGSVLSITFEIRDQQLLAHTGGTEAPFNHSISLLVNCDSQTEIDRLWENLLVNGGRTLQCDWVQDQFGVCWRIVPAMLYKMLQDKQRTPAVMSALLTMNKLDIAQLEQTYQQGD